MTSGVPWIDNKLGELSGAREFLTRAGMAPQRVSGSDPREMGGSFYASPTRWKVPYFVVSFDDAELIALAKERGFNG
jgi:hypothetical protein